jgi:hypothetical protein
MLGCYWIVDRPRWQCDEIGWDSDDEYVVKVMREEIVFETFMRIILSDSFTGMMRH